MEYLLNSCLSIGLSYSDFKELQVGTILDILTERANQLSNNKDENKNSDVREATSNDNILSFF